MKTKILILCYAIIAAWATFNIGNWERKRVMEWDKLGYYVYLPAVFVSHDLAGMSIFPTVVDEEYRDNNFKWYGIYDIPETGKKINKYPLGVAIMELPFFLMAHAYTLWLTDFPANGFTQIYQQFVAFSTIFWVIIGLLFLRKLLRRYYSENVTFFTILLIAFGTNLYNYTLFDQGMSHSYSFALFACFLYCVNEWYSYGKLKHLLWIGILLGFIAIVRPSNILIALIPLLWMQKEYLNGNSKWQFLRQNMKGILGSMLLCFLVMMIQMSYWHYVTGHWIYYSYIGESFNFSDPEIWNGLVSYRKGWFLYTPVALVAMLGFIVLFYKNRRLAMPLFVFILINIYVIFSWSQWYYGGSFGCRALIESFAVLSIPLAALLNYFANAKIKIAKYILGVILLFFVLLNVFQTYQFILSILPTDGMTEAHYWEIWGKDEP